MKSQQCLMPLSLFHRAWRISHSRAGITETPAISWMPGVCRNPGTFSIGAFKEPHHPPPFHNRRYPAWPGLSPAGWRSPAHFQSHRRASPDIVHFCPVHHQFKVKKRRGACNSNHVPRSSSAPAGRNTFLCFSGIPYQCARHNPGQEFFLANA